MYLHNFGEVIFCLDWLFSSRKTQTLPVQLKQEVGGAKRNEKWNDEN
jgi:hypothetical protein